MGAPQVHHYVPQFLLNRFKDPVGDVLHVYDKQTDHVFATNPQKVAAEKSFYEIETDWGKVTAEPGLAALETTAARIIEMLITQESLAGLLAEDRVKLATFFAVQFTRTRHLRENVASINQQMAERFQALGIDPSNVENFKVFTDDDIKRFSIDFMIKSVEEFTPLLLDKIWLLTRTVQMLQALETGSPLELHEQNVIRENYLQIRWASRFVFSSNGDFALVKKMLNETAAYRTGPRSELA